MENNISIIAILYLIGAAQGCFLALALYNHRSGNRLANRYLSLLTMVFTLALIDYFFDVTALINDYIWVRTVLWPKEFLYGIFIYFYARELTLPEQFPLAGKQWLHFIPAITHVVVTWPLLLLDDQRQLLILTNQTDQGFDGFMALLLGNIELYATIFQITLYLWLALMLIKQHNQRIRNNFSNIDAINLKWLSRLLFGIFLVYLIWLGEELLSKWIQQEPLWDALLGGSMVVLIYSMGYLGLRQPLIFSNPSVTKTLDSIEHDIIETSNEALNKTLTEPNNDKYKNSPLDANLSQAFLDELETHMQKQKPYLDNQISLPELASQLNMSLNYLSQIINQQTGKNFFDFINSYRINEAKEHLSNNTGQSKNILDLAMSVGFNSKSAFYNAFRKHTNMTPTEFRHQIKSS